MNEQDLKHLEFVIYCIETYKGKKNLDGITVYQKLNNCGAIDFIDNNYEALHTFGDDQIVWNIDEFISNVHANR